METQTILYMDAYPGVGKTTLAIDHIIKTGGKRVSIYVAPRHMLLKQVAERFRSRAIELYGENKISEECARRIFKTNDRYYVEPDDVRKTLIVHEESVGKERLSVGERYREAMVIADEGDLILTTHENFILNGGLYGEDPDRFMVYFDEARKMILEKKDQYLTVSAEQRYTMLSALEEYRKPMYRKTAEGHKVYSGFSHYHAPREKEMKLVKELRKLVHESAGVTGVDTSPVSAFRSFVADVCSERVDVYLKVPETIDELEDEKERDRKMKGFTASKYTVFQVVSPARMFDGFKNVVVMSAYFKESQIYHLLKNYHLIHPSKNKRILLKPIPMSEETAKSIRAARKRIESRFKKVHIFPLLDKKQKVSTYNLSASCLLPRSKVEEFFLDLEEKLGMDRVKLMSILVNKQKGSIAREIKQRAGLVAFFRPRRDCKANQRGYAEPIHGYVNLAQKIAYEISMTNEGRHSWEIVGRPLLSLNKKFMPGGGYFETEYHPFGHVVREPSTRELEEGIQLNPDLKIYRAVNEKSVTFDHVIPDPMGLNTYRDRNFIAYLAARNPTPDVAALFKVLIPDYDPDQDYAGDSAVQAVTRLSVREPRATDQVFIVVPDVGLAEILRGKMTVVHPETGESGGATIDMKYAKEFDMVDVLTAVGEEVKVVHNEGMKKRNIKTAEVEKKDWPESLREKHEFLISTQSMRGNLLRRGIKSDGAWLQAKEIVNTYDSFVKEAQAEIERNPRRRGNLESILEARTKESVLESMRKLSEMIGFREGEKVVLNR